MVVVVGIVGVWRGKLPGVVLHQLYPRRRQVSQNELPWRGVGGVGLLAVTSSGERQKAPLLVTYGGDVTETGCCCRIYRDKYLTVRKISTQLTQNIQIRTDVT